MLESFRGVFDGNDHTISNLNMTSTRERYAGLFGYVSGQIKNLGLANPKVFAQGINVGALAGFLDSGTLTRCYAKGVDVAGDDNIGGLVGYSTGRIYYCYSTGKVAGDWYVGGLIGLVTDSTVNASFSKAHVSGNGNVGGLAGKTGDETSVLSDCYATGNGRARRTSRARQDLQVLFDGPRLRQSVCRGLHRLYQGLGRRRVLLLGHSNQRPANKRRRDGKDHRRNADHQHLHRRGLGFLEHLDHV
ncbi:MAG: GLUG motif-containing protein [Planctomycetota bacterium]